jgi:ferredoxin-NADP reductase
LKRVIEWQIATVTAIKQETPTVKSITLELPDWSPHLPGQHYDIRLTAEDGYQAQRSYSVASPPEQTGTIDITVEQIEDGEVSPYLDGVLEAGDRLEVRGPIGGYFVWDVGTGGPLLLIAGGSGVVPLMAMIRHRSAQSSSVPTTLLYSVRSPDQVIYRSELEQAAGMNGLLVIYTYTRTQPPGWKGLARRIDQSMLKRVLSAAGPPPLTFVCGPTALVETAANALVALGVAPNRVKTERFGPSGK